MMAADALGQLDALPWRKASAIAAPVLILAPHADDESLGCGGLIATLVEQGRPPFVLFVTDGAGSHPNSATYPASRLRALREQEAMAACTILGLNSQQAGFMRLPDTNAPSSGPAFDTAVAVISARCRAIGAATILAPWEHDPHSDHLAAHRMAVVVAGRLSLAHWAYPVWGWTLPPSHILPDNSTNGMRLDITGYLPRKRQAIAAHRSQYAGLITDDPGGFVLPTSLLALFDRPYETFIKLR